MGNCYWIVDEIEAGLCHPLLADAGKAKLIIGNMNKTGKLDADRLALPLYNCTLPSVWIPCGEQRDLSRH